MITKKDLLNLAQDKLGLTEQKDYAALSDFFFHEGGFRLDPRAVPWCAAFVNSVLGEAEIKGTGSLAARSFLGWGKPVEIPEPGDIVILRRGSNQWQGHVAFYYSIDSNLSRGIKLLGGNQSDEVCIKTYDSNNVLGYRSAI